MLIDDLDATRSFLGVTSSASAVSDLLAVNPVSPADETRLAEIRMRIRAHLWREDLGSALPVEFDGRFPSQPLEERIRRVLEPRRVKLLAAILGITPEKIEIAASRLFAIDIRGGGMGSRNPSAPFQTLRLNDPVLHSGLESHLSLTTLSPLVNDYCRDSREYWRFIETTNLYDTQDFAVLKLWHMHPPGAGGNPRSPSEQISHECAQWENRLKAFTEAQEILYLIAVRTIGYFLSGWPSQAPPANDPVGRGYWLAKSVIVDTLDLAPQLVDAHALHVQRIGPLIVQYKDVLTARNLVFPGGSQTHLLDDWAKLIASPIVDRIVTTQWELRVPDLMGGLLIRPGFEASIPRLRSTANRLFDDVPEPLRFYYNEPREIFFRTFLNPSSLIRGQAALRDWRNDADLAIKALTPASSFDDARLLIELMWRYHHERTEMLRTAMQHVVKAHTIAKAIFALNEPLGSTSLGRVELGRLALPSDSRVVAVYAGVGEFAELDRPILAVQHKYRRNGRVILAAADLQRLDLVISGAYEVIIGVPTPESGTVGAPHVRTVAAVRGIAPTNTGGWSLDLEIFPVFDVWQLIGAAPGLPKVLPVQDRYCLPSVEVLEERVCVQAAAMLPTQGVFAIDFRGRLL